jgi:hypothetical protein
LLKGIYKRVNMIAKLLNIYKPNTSNRGRMTTYLRGDALIWGSAGNFSDIGGGV